MKLTYDPGRNVAYLRFRRSKARVETLSISDELNIDIAADGSVYGIELLNANDQLEHFPKGKLSVENSQTGEKRELPLP